MEEDKKETKKKAAAVGQQPSASQETASPYPKMDLCQRMHRLTTAKHPDVELQCEVFTQIAVELENPSLYERLQEKLYDGMKPNISQGRLTAADLDEIEERNNKAWKELEKKLEEAKESAGDMEIMEARVAMARFAAKSLSEEQALEAFQQVLDLPKTSSGKKIDALMESARVASFYGDTSKADDLIDRAHKLASTGSGADWDRRNRLKVYRALQRLLHRDTEQAAELLLECIATFSCNEICTYKEFIVYAILTNMLHLPRPDLKKKIIDGPEVLSVSADIPIVVRSFLLRHVNRNPSFLIRS
jgi:26S proteasome regulatory subunit N7